MRKELDGVDAVVRRECARVCIHDQKRVACSWLGDEGMLCSKITLFHVILRKGLLTHGPSYGPTDTPYQDLHSKRLKGKFSVTDTN